MVRMSIILHTLVAICIPLLTIVYTFCFIGIYYNTFDFSYSVLRAAIEVGMIVSTAVYHILPISMILILGFDTFWVSGTASIISSIAIIVAVPILLSWITLDGISKRYPAWFNKRGILVEVKSKKGE